MAIEAKDRQNRINGKGSVWAIQRMYSYEAEQTGETQEQWRERLERELSVETLQKGYTRFDGVQVPGRVNVTSSVYIFHDAADDVDDESGLQKGLHVHAVVRLGYSPHEGKGIRHDDAMELFGCSRYRNCQAVKQSAVGAYRYLIHATEAALSQKKTVYPVENLRISLDDNNMNKYQGSQRGLYDFWYDQMSGRATAKETREKKEMQEQALTAYTRAVAYGALSVDQVIDLIDSDVACCDFTVKDGLKAQPTLEAAARKYARDFKSWCVSHTICRTNIYVEGIGGAGKDTFGRRLAVCLGGSDRDVHMVSARGNDTSFDMADGYTMERVSLATEVEGAAFSLSQFLTVFDSKYSYKANSRNSDKFYAPEYVIMNNSIPIEEFISDVCEKLLLKDADFSRNYDPATLMAESKNANKIAQVRRRFAILVQIRKETGELCIFWRDNACNPDRLYVGGRKPAPGQSPYKLFAKVDGFDPDDESSVDQAVSTVIAAISYYYTANKFSITPWNSNRSGFLDTRPKVALPGDDWDPFAAKELVITYRQPRTSSNDDARIFRYTVGQFWDTMRNEVAWLEKGLERGLTPETVPKGFYKACSWINDAFHLVYLHHLKHIKDNDVERRFIDVKDKLEELGLWIKKQH